MAASESNGVPGLGFHNPAGSILKDVRGLLTYPMGNTRGRDLTEDLGTKKEQPLDILLLASGDVRHLFFTVSGISLRKPPDLPKCISFHLNDYNPSIVARNAIILEIANTMNPDVQEDVDFLWNIWYNMTLPKPHLDRLRAVLTSLIERNFDGSEGFLKFQDSNVLQECRGIWKDWRELDLEVDNVKRERREYMGSKITDLHSGMMVQLLISPNDLRDVLSPILEEIKHWFDEGSTNDDGHLNPTLICPFTHKWKVHYASCAFLGYLTLRREDYIRCGSFTAYCKENTQMLVKQFQQFQHVTPLEATLWTGDGLWLCTSGLPQDLKFDIIDTSDVCDQIGLLNVLVCCSPRLKRPLESQMFTSSILWTGDSETMIEYYNMSVGVHTHLLPTVLGLKLAVNFDLGTRKLPGKKNTTEQIFCWVKADNTRTVLTLEEESDVVDALLKLTERCFRYYELLEKKKGQIFGANLPSPLTLLRIIHQLNALIDGGANRILNLLQQKLSSHFDSYFFLSWNLVNGSLGNMHEPIVEIQVNMNISTDEPIIPVILIMDREDIKRQTMMGPSKIQVIHNMLRYDEQKQVVTFHLTEKDWNDFKDKSLLHMVTNYMGKIESAKHVLLEDESVVLSVRQVDPVETFGLFSVQTFDICPSKGDSQILEVMKVEESINSYSAELSILDPSKCKESEMKFNFHPESCPTKVYVKFGDEDGCTMYFSCPVDKNSLKFGISSKEGKVTCHMDKKEDGTVGECVLQNPAPVPFHALDLWENGLDKISEKMFRTKLDKQLREENENDEGDAFFNLRESISFLLATKLRYPKTTKLYFFEDQSEDPIEAVEEMLQRRGLIIKVEEIYRWNDLPVAKVIFYDCKRYNDVIKGNPNVPESKRIIESFDEGLNVPSATQIKTNEQEIDLFLKILHTNAARVSQENIPGSPVWKASFICYLFPREGEKSLVEGLIEMGMEFPSEMMATFIGNIISSD